MTLRFVYSAFGRPPSRCEHCLQEIRDLQGVHFFQTGEEELTLWCGACAFANTKDELQQRILAQVNQMIVASYRIEKAFGENLPKPLRTGDFGQGRTALIRLANLEITAAITRRNPWGMPPNAPLSSAWFYSPWISRDYEMPDGYKYFRLQSPPKSIHLVATITYLRNEVYDLWPQLRQEFYRRQLLGSPVAEHSIFSGKIS